MGENILIPIENVEAFSADLGEIAEELEQRRSNVSGILSELYGTWSGTGKGAFQESAASQDARFGRILQSFQYAQRVFANTVIPGLHSLQLTASRLGAAFDVGGESDGGTLKLSESSNLSSEKTAIQEAALDAAQYFTAALNSLSLVSSAAVSSEGILAIKKTTEENAERFETFTTGFQNYKNSVRLFCRGLHESFGVLSASDEYRNVLLGFDPSLLDSAGQQLWAEAMYQFCMKDDSVWKNILGKPADEISPTEYALLASVYASLDPEKLDDFLTECMTCVENHEQKTGDLTPSYSMWTMDETKVKNLMLYGTLLYTVTLEHLRGTEEGDTWSDEYEQLFEDSKQIMQRNVLLREVSSTGTIFGNYNAVSPIQITCDPNNNLIVKYRQSYTTSYTKHEYISDGMGYMSCDISVPVFEQNILPERIIISAPVSGQNIKFKNLERFEYVASSRFGVGQAIVSFSEGQIRDYSLQAVTTGVEYGLKLAGKSAHFVPILGEVISVAVDLGCDLHDAKEDTAFIHAQVNNMRASYFYGDFDCNAVFVTRESNTVVPVFEGTTTMPSTTIAVHVEEGRDTRVCIDKFNSLFEDYGFEGDSKLTVSQLIDPYSLSSEAFDDPSSIFNRMEVARDQHQNLYSQVLQTNLP